MNPFEYEDEWSDDGLDFDILDDTNEPSNGLVSVQEVMEFANEQGITFIHVLSSHFCRYDSGDGNEVKEKYHIIVLKEELFFESVEDCKSGCRKYQKRPLFGNTIAE